MAYKTLPTLSLQGKVSNDIFVRPTQKQVIQYMERQVCLVTGAAQGLGNEFCRAFMRS
jgi:FlaA1/EpsC-like NDP-sugar epimerase